MARERIIEVDRIRLLMVTVGGKRLWVFVPQDASDGASFDDRDAAMRWLMERLEGGALKAYEVKK